MKSLYLDKEIVLSETKDTENNEVLVSHEELKKALTSPSIEEYRIVYNYEFIKTEKEHAIVLCTISDKGGRRIQEVGESTAKNNDIATDAAKKAFDKAVITYFNFEKKVIPNYSEADGPILKAEEPTIGEVKTTEEEDIFLKTIESAEMESVADENVVATIKVNEEVDLNKSEEIHDSKIQITTEASEDETSKHETHVSDISNMSVTIGKYDPEKNPKNTVKTIKEIYEEDRTWFNYICEKFTKPGKKPEHLEQANAMREYAKSMLKK